MKKNKIVLVLSCIFSMLFLTYIFKLARDIKKSEENLIASPNVVDVTDAITTKLLILSENYTEETWSQPSTNDSTWKNVNVPKHRIVQEPEFKEGNFAYYRINVPQKSFHELNHLKNELFLALQYIQFSKLDIYVNGKLFRSNTPIGSEEYLINIPIDESRDNLVAIKGYVKAGDSGINHRGKIIVGKGGELNEIHRKAYKAATVYTLIFLLCKGSILFVFTLIFLVVKVDKFFEKSLLYGFFVLAEDVLTGNYLYEYLNLNQQVYLFNIVDIGIIVFLFLFLSDVLEKKYSKRHVAYIVAALALPSFIIAIDVLHTGHFFNIDHFLKFWNYALILVLFYFAPKVFKEDKVLFSIILISLFLTVWSAVFSDNVGFNFKAFGNLFIFFMVAYQTFILFRRQQNQLTEQEKDVAIGKTAAHLAHDVRRPLDQMSLILNRISAGEANPEFLKVAKQDVEFAITSVNNQINDIMNFSRTRGIELEPVSFYGVLSASIKQVLAIKKNVNIDLEYDFKAPNKILGDESRLASVLTNLISNAVEAIKDIGGKTSGVIKLTTFEEKEYLVFKIFNDGPQIPLNVLGDIFKPLFTFGKSSGTGLGLASVSKIVNEHGGLINVVNLLNGVEFILRFRTSELVDTFTMTTFKAKSADYSYVSKNKIAATENRNLRILLLDDDRYVYEYFQDFIKKAPFEIELVHTGDVDRAKEALKAKRFDLYILDYDLGSNTTGLDFYHENLNFLKNNVVLHSNRDRSTINNIDINLYPKPMPLETFIELCEQAFKTRLRLLLVEDSKLISLAWKMFHGKHNILCVSSPEEALAFLGNDPTSVDICVLDYYYDWIEMNGEDLGDKIRLLFPELKIIISTSASFQTSRYLSVKKNAYEVRNLDK